MLVQVKLSSRAVVDVDGPRGRWFRDYIFPNISVSQAAFNCDCASLYERAVKEKREAKGK